MMMNDDPSQDCPYYWLNEWLCEYVDGTMDPSVRLVFEEYLEANPELAAHVKELCHTRQMLCGCADPCTDDEVRARVQERICRDMAEAEHAQTERPQEDDEVLLPGGSSVRMAAAIASAMIVMLSVGMFVGATVFAPPKTGSQSRAAAAASVHERAPARAAEDGRAIRLADDRAPVQHAPSAASPAARALMPSSASALGTDTLHGSTLLRSASAMP